ncbi:methyltransferase, FxLD system [Streptomyces sp. NBC_01102]|uniref:methyltransferase, FxLD system n=1 Tax=Streptomyces sp. NBC_01102 TaxID=2903749 RepID=UPI0038647F08|nr:methyltransferase, FxLD system [Streptomyces sp. NBC_01102]
MTRVTTGNDRALELRDKVVDTLIADGTITSKAVATAMRTVPRHRFAPEAELDAAYDAYRAVITKKDEFGVDQSSVSAPQIQAVQAEQADIQPGMRVLEIGSGGYNAALLAELVGELGEVTTVDIDPEVTDRAQRLLSETGYSRVRVVCADAADGVPAHGPYDRILVTVGAWDIPPAWVAQLLPRGRLVVPLRMRGLTRSIAFDRTGDFLTSVSAQVCGFVPMQGAGAHREELLLVNGTNEIGLRFDDGLPAHPSRLDNAVRTSRVENWSGVTIGRQESFDTLQMHLASVLDGFCIMAVDADLDTGLVAPANKWFSMATVDDGSFAYATTRRTPDDASVEFGVHAFGPDAGALAQHVSEQIRSWDRERRGGPGPTVSVFPAGTPDDQLPGERVIDKHHCRVTFSWPSAANPA